MLIPVFNSALRAPHSALALPRVSNQPTRSDYIKRQLLLSAVCLLPFLTGCATYQVGNASLFPTDVQTVYVPIVESASFRPDLGEKLTEAIIREIEHRTNYKVVGTPNADSILSAKLIEDTKRVIVENSFDEARSTEVNYQVRVTWINRKGDQIYNGAVPLPPQFVQLGQGANYIPEFGHSYTSTEQHLIQKMAAQIVGLMEKPW